MGVRRRAERAGWRCGPPAAREYAELPAWAVTPRPHLGSHQHPVTLQEAQQPAVRHHHQLQEEGGEHLHPPRPLPPSNNHLVEGGAPGLHPRAPHHPLQPLPPLPPQVSPQRRQHQLHHSPPPALGTLGAAPRHLGTASD